MITAQIVSPWAETPPPTPGRHPKVLDDYTLASCREAAGRGVPYPDTGSVPVVIECSHEVWEAIVHDPEYGMGNVYWYQEQGRQKRLMRLW